MKQEQFTSLVTPQIRTWHKIRFCERPPPYLNDATYEAYARMSPEVWDHNYYGIVEAITRDEP